MAKIRFSPFEVSCSSVVPVCLPFRDHSVSPWRMMKTLGVAIVVSRGTRQVISSASLSATRLDLFAVPGVYRNCFAKLFITNQRISNVVSDLPHDVQIDDAMPLPLHQDIICQGGGASGIGCETKISASPTSIVSITALLNHDLF